MYIVRDRNNCHYRNLVWVGDDEYIDLERGILLTEELGRQQEYIPYITLKSNTEYYECGGESMAVDKDLLFQGNKEYAPDKCCILPQTLNTMLSNCKKHRLPKWKSAKMDLPLGVRYDNGMGMYYGEIKPFGHDEVVRLSYWETPEQAFEEYKKHKQADILMMADKYKSRIPKKVYDALLRFEVKPYVED